MRRRPAERIPEPTTPESQKAYIRNRDERENSALIEAYDALAEKAIASYRTIFRRDPKTVLEIGCGTGHTAAGLAQRLPTSEIIAVDKNPDAIDACRERYGNSVDFKVAEVTDLDPYRGIADLAVSIASMHEFPNLQQSLNSIRLAMSGQGVYFFTDLNREDLSRVAVGFFNPEITDPAEHFLNIRKRLSVSQYSYLLKDEEALERIFHQGSAHNNRNALLLLSSYASAYTCEEVESALLNAGFEYVTWPDEKGFRGMAIKRDVEKPEVVLLRSVQRARRLAKNLRNLIF